MNFLTGAVMPSPDGVVFRSSAGDTAPLAGVPDLPIGADQEVTLGVRPHDLFILPKGSPGLPMRVTLTQLVGSDKQISLEGRAGDLVARVEADAVLVAGDEVSCQIRPGKVHLFGADGERIVT
jgi:ABC-type sugar transport system ATPase subunit